MSTAADLREAVLGVFRRDARLFWSTRLRVVSQTLALFFSLTIFRFVSRLVNVPAFPRPDDYFAYVAIGLVVLALLTATLTALPLAVRQELVAGTFERFAVSATGAVVGLTFRTSESLFAPPLFGVFGGLGGERFECGDELA